MTSNAFVAQLIVNAIVSGALYSLVACSMALMFRLSGAYNFALGHLTVLAAYLFIAIQVMLGGGLLLATLVLICCAPILGRLVRISMISPFEPRGSLAVMIATLVCSAAIEALLLITSGPDFQRPLDLAFWSDSFSFGAQISILEVTLVVLSVLTILAAERFLRSSGYGRSFIALCDNKLPASAIGVNSGRVENIAYSIAMIWVVLAAVFGAYQMNTQAQLGFVFTLKALAVLTCVGARDLRIIFVAAVMLGLFENLFVLTSDLISISYKDSVAVAIMIVALLIRQPTLRNSRAG